MQRITQAIVTALPLLIAAGSAQAVLIDRGGGLIYDSTLNITWLQNATPAAGSVYDDGWNAFDGRMSFVNAQAWAANLNYTVGAVTYSDWRLPQGVDFGAPGGFPAPPFSGPGCDWQYSGYDCGFNVAPSSSELGHLWYVDLGNLSQYFDNPADPFNGTPRPGIEGVNWGLLNTGPFLNLQPYLYWSAIINPVDPTQAWRHWNTANGRVSWRAVEEPDYIAWAVADGDIANAAVSHAPEPDTYAMLLAGLGLLGFVARRRKQKVA